MLLLNLLGYRFWGLNGLGISFLVGYFFYLLQVYIVAKLKYSFFFERAMYFLFLIQFFIATLCFVVVKLLITPYSYIVGSALIMLSLLYSFKELDKRIGLMVIYNSILNKILKKS